MKNENVKFYNSKYKINLSVITIVAVILAMLSTRYLILMLWGKSLQDQMMFTEQDMKILIAIFVVASVMFWAIAICFIVKIIRITPVLELDERGIIQKGGLIPWDEIEKIARFTMDTGYNARNYLGIWVKDLNAVCKNFSIFAAEEIKENFLEGAAPISIAENELEESIEDTIMRIYRFKKKVYDRKQGE